MDTGTLVVGVILILLFISPFVIFGSRGKKNKEKDLLKSLDDLASRNNCTIKERECWNNSAIGMDAGNKMLFYFYKSETQTFDRVVKLSEIQSCRVDIARHKTGVKGEEQQVIDNISIILEFKEKKRVGARLTFYDSETDRLQLNDELQLAEVWSKKISEIISHKKPYTQSIPVAV